MDILPENCRVLADRGFKQIDDLLSQKNCELIRPLTVSQSLQLSKKEVLLTKSIASLRTRVEMVIRRVREYKILEPHATLNSNILSSINDIVFVTCALINLQKAVIRT